MAESALAHEALLRGAGGEEEAGEPVIEGGAVGGIPYAWCHKAQRPVPLSKAKSLCPFRRPLPPAPGRPEDFDFTSGKVTPESTHCHCIVVVFYHDLLEDL